MSLTDELSFSPADTAKVLAIESDSMLDVYRDAEREAWVAFAAAPSIATRKEHFLRLMALIREVDTRAGLLLERQ